MNWEVLLERTGIPKQCMVSSNTTQNTRSNHTSLVQETTILISSKQGKKTPSTNLDLQQEWIWSSRQSKNSNNLQPTTILALARLCRLETSGGSALRREKDLALEVFRQEQVLTKFHPKWLKGLSSLWVPNSIQMNKLQLKRIQAQGNMTFKTKIMLTCTLQRNFQWAQVREVNLRPSQSHLVLATMQLPLPIKTNLQDLDLAQVVDQTCPRQLREMCRVLAHTMPKK